MRKISVVLLLLMLPLILFKVTGCTSNNQRIQNNEDTLPDPVSLALLDTYCLSCHIQGEAQSNKLAPTFSEIKQHYLKSNDTQQSFVSAFIEFMNNPSAQTSQMPAAIVKYGLMPKMSLPEDYIRQIAAHLYNADTDSEIWKEQLAQVRLTSHAVDTSLSYEALGLKYATATKSELGKNLLEAITSLGTPGAIEFCNTRAFHITDSMAKAFNVKIKRVTDKPRNPDNMANAVEIDYIESLKILRAKGSVLPPKVVESDDKIFGFYPIETNKMCLQCHGGKNTDIFPETEKRIVDLYPTDRATGYSENQVRGIWVVEMPKRTRD